MQKKYQLITVVTLVLAVIAVAGYAGYLGGVQPKEPIRILYATKGGNVVFSHIAHFRDYELTCEKCHHESAERTAEPLPCRNCHSQVFDEVFAEQHQNNIPGEFCGRCHHQEPGDTKFAHAEHSDEFSDDCTDCHHNEDIESEPGNCNECHEAEGDVDTPGLKDAVHKRCNACHEEMFQEGLNGCSSCHEMKDAGNVSCRECHKLEEGIEDILPNRLNAFHTGCMNCHEENQKGPFTKEDCKQCHLG